jgi:predicted phosphoadenosine phosphosulfate sulfurtransferase
MNGSKELRKRIKTYIRKWELSGYESGMPDEAPRRLEEINKVGSYRLLCIALMKNDVTLKTLGFSRPPCKLYNQLKRAELMSKGRIVSEPPRQIEMF